MNSTPTTQSGEKRRKVSLMRALGNLVNLLPTGSVFFYQILSSATTNYNHCEAATKGLTISLVALTGLLCIISSFTDSYIGADGTTRHAIVTPGGLRPKPARDDNINLAAYRLRVGDFAHAFLATMVYAAVVLFDKKTIHCLFPQLESNSSRHPVIVGSTVGGVGASIALAFSSTGRNWWGYPPNKNVQVAAAANPDPNVSAEAAN